MRAMPIVKSASSTPHVERPLRSMPGGLQLSPKPQPAVEDQRIAMNQGCLKT